ncbi:MAG: hypothetical protein KatS3mg126_0106 [Lysobacteraceae bacterium]|nr:MAG: hypothetical protein KatS3mg126_0106 [Xanthomonadaceae bacterium]
MIHSNHPRLAAAQVTGPARQRGAALFIALAILIIVSLLGIAASRVTVLQERMADAYLADLGSFLFSEDRLRFAEREASAAVAESCESSLLPTAPANSAAEIGQWLAGAVNTPRVLVEIVPVPASLGNDVALPPLCPVRITVMDFADAARTSRAVVQSLYITP